LAFSQAGAVGDQGVAGGVALVERVVAGGQEVVPELARHAFGHAAGAQAGHEGFLKAAHELHVLLAMALRRSSAWAGLKPATRRAMAMYCSW